MTKRRLTIGIALFEFTNGTEVFYVGIFRVENTHKSNPYPSHVQVYEADGYDGMENCVDVQTWNRIHAEVERQICFEAYEGTKTAASSAKSSS